MECEDFAVMFNIKPHSLSICFIKDDKSLVFDIITKCDLSDNQIWYFILGKYDIPSFEVWSAYSNKENAQVLYNRQVFVSRQIESFFGLDFLREKMDVLDW